MPFVELTCDLSSTVIDQQIIFKFAFLSEYLSCLLPLPIQNFLISNSRTISKMNLRTFLTLLCLFSAAAAAAQHICGDGDCHGCAGDTCHLTCRGKGCGVCPDGSCCNGANCDVCVLSVCCSTADCNACVRKERGACHGAKDAGNSSCEAAVADKCGLSTDQQLSNETAVLSEGNYGHNITTIIKIRNVINNTQALKLPILFNISNVHDITLNKTKLKAHHNVTHANIDVTSDDNKLKLKKCCSIVHPQECHKIGNIPNKVCFTRKHTECSDICNRSSHLLVKSAANVAKTCIIIAAHPYYYCGYYALEDCSSCYHCKELDKITCLKQSSCSETCRSSILPKRFYNVPYYINIPHSTWKDNGTHAEYPAPE